MFKTLQGEIMGSIAKIEGKVDLGPPDHNVLEGKWNLPFAIELKENIHIHWQDIRIEMNVQDFEAYATAMINALNEWKKIGKPKSLPQCNWLARWPGEETYHFYKDRLKRLNIFGKLCHHFRNFPRTEGGKRINDNCFQIERQTKGQYHIHYKNFRWELGAKQAKRIAEAFKGVSND